MRILIAEDEKATAMALKLILEKAMFSADVVENGNLAWDFVSHSDYDVVVLDIMMPGKSGLEVLQLMRANSINTPVLLLTAKSEVEDRISGLESGADDYLPKPFSTGELVARIRALARRSTSYNDSVLSAGNLSLDTGKYEMFTSEGSYKLTNKEYQLLELFMRNKGVVFSTEHLMEKIWGYESQSDIGVVWTHIGFVRRKLDSLKSDVQIKTIRGAGYALEEKTC